ncbi:MAG: phosphoribosylformylglycinamidine synthase subunit PurL [Acidimicrobiales bacterium]|nr:phosphoribosylformylglycinamidine synthase subunit PurL [Acidimicrobiales bacterium]MDG1878334.1 phosphoribosylformylglycinamidine synthase subunit PurL [Acidimicrobiales bacterium]
MTVRIDVTAPDDPRGAHVVANAPLVGVVALAGCRVTRVHHVEGDVTATQIAELCEQVLVDPVVDSSIVDGVTPAQGRVVEVALMPGATDPDARELEQAARNLGLPAIRVVTARRYDLIGELSDTDVATLTRRLLANDTIEISTEGELPAEFAGAAEADVRVDLVPLDSLSDDELAQLSHERVLSLDLREMQAIQAHFAAEGRHPRDAELETLAQTWSEHCVHKTFRATIDLTHTAADGTVTRTQHDGLLPALREVTEELDPPWLRSAFVDDAGIVAFDDEFDIAFKVETHNHPSALEPFGGANTGVGGVVRDVIGVSARPIACTDVLCFGPADLPDDQLPTGVLHPRRIRDGVVAGIGDYGNKLGLPTVNGAVLYHEGYTANPLVYCGALGILPHGSHPTKPEVGDRIISLGGRVGRDGIHGATFSSAGMDASTVDHVGSAVQIGDPITEKGLIEVIERARDAHLYNAITDCGAGGFSSSVGEMGEDLGVDVDLSAVPLKYPGLQPWEIWLSEAQERIVIAVPPAKLHMLRDLCGAWDVEVTDLGTFTGSERLVVRYGDTPVVDVPMAFLHDGIPRREMDAAWADSAPTDVVVPAIGVSHVLRLLAHPNVASKEDIIRRYDHEVRGGTVVRPYVGPEADGPADAAVLKPLGTAGTKAVVLSNGICPSVGRHDPYAMALLAMDEAVRNLVAVGGDPDQVAVLDNFCWGDPTKSDRLGSLVRAVQGCTEGARRYSMPFISGKDSLFNEFDGEAIPGTLLISALGLVPDLHRAIDSAGMADGDDVWLVGEHQRALGGSLASDEFNLGATDVPTPLHDPLPRYRAIHAAIASGLISAAHDCSDGGLAVAVAEMAIAARLGVTINVPADGFDPATALVNEAPGRLVLTASVAERPAVAAMLGEHGRRIGSVTGDTSVTLGEVVVPLDQAVAASTKGLVG